jgi:fermentation-respiration switch protein FrsA (DUF1100 family)
MDAWIEHTLDDDPLAAESWAELLEACPTDSEEFMPTKTPPPNARLRQKQAPPHFSTNIVHHYFKPSLRSCAPDEAGLLGTAYVFGTPYHFQFIEVKVRDGVYRAVHDPFNRLEAVEALYDQPLQVTTIDGKQYIGFAHPHGS